MNELTEHSIQLENKLGLTFYNRQQVTIDYGRGSEVWDTAGTRYLDFTSGWGVACLGHAHPIIIDALASQAGRLTQNPNSGFTYSPVRAKLLAALGRILPVGLERTCFVNSGAEANDLALKLARRISRRSRIVSTLGSFHGRTQSAWSVTGGPGNLVHHQGASGTTDFVPFGDVAAIGQAIGDDTAAVIVEPIQGEGGVRVPPIGYLRQVSELCRESGVFLIIDEVQTGFCRTGSLFAVDREADAVRPDFLSLGKGLAGGFPLAALSVSGRVAEQVEKGDHGGTYCGNPLGCAVSLAVVEFLVNNRIAERVAVVGQELLEGLLTLTRRYPALLREARGAGLLTALELTEDALVPLLTQACLERGLLVTPTRNGIIRLIPDLLVSQGHVQEALAILGEALTGLEPRVAAAS